jgi:hypothetical protein
VKKFGFPIVISMFLGSWLCGQGVAQQLPYTFYFQQGSTAGQAAGDSARRATVTLQNRLAELEAKAEAGVFWLGSTDFGQIVTGAPYSATATTESIQVLADGNRIVKKTTAFLARDGKGRTRRDETMDKVGPWAVQGPKVSYIQDPVAGADYVFNGNDTFAQVVKRGELLGLVFPTVKSTAISNLASLYSPSLVLLDGEGDGDVKTETLDTQTIEGVPAKGRRVTHTIPAGQIGNERPIEVTSEVWYSPDLQMIVLSKHKDPRIGETVYKLTGIKRGEPDPSLFRLPDGYIKVHPRVPPFSSLPYLRTPPTVPDDSSGTP